MAHADGAHGTRFRSDLFLLNPSAAETAVRLTYLPAGADNFPLPEPAELAVPAGEQVVTADVVASLFGRLGSGAVLVEAAASSLVVGSRTYHQAGEGRYGLFLPGHPLESAIRPSETGHILYLAKSAAFRTNLVLVNASGDPGSVEVELLGEERKHLGSVRVALRGWEQRQINDLFAAAGAAPSTEARAEVLATVPHFAVATVVDNRTGDGFPVPAQRVPADYQLRTGYGVRSLVPAAAHAPGKNGAQFRTDMRVLHASPYDLDAWSITFHPRDAPSSARFTHALALSPWRLFALDDVLSSIFRQENAAGALRVSSLAPLVVFARTYDDSPAGTVSLSAPAATPLEFAYAGDSVNLVALSAERARTNLMLFNDGEEELDLDLELVLHRPGGAVSFRGSRTVPPTSMAQIDGIFEELGAPASGNASLTLRARSGGPYWAAATVIDGGSNDPYLVNGSVDRHWDEDACVEVKAPRARATYTVFESTGGSSTFEQAGGPYPPGGGLWSRTSSTGATDYFQTSYRAGGPANALAYLAATSQFRPGYFGYQQISVTTYEPPRAAGPLRHHCAGMSWAIEAGTARTTDLVANVSATVPTAAGLGEVVAVGEPVTTAGRTFLTVHSRTTLSAPADATGAHPVLVETWLGIEEGMPIQEITVDSTGKTSTTLLTAIE